MSNSETQKLLNYKRLMARMREIESMSTEDSLILSCYVDTDKGKQACCENISKTFNHSRALMPHNEHINVNKALNRLQLALNNNWHPQARGMAIFIDIHGESDSVVLALPSQVKEQLSIYPRPDLLPLMNLQGDFDNSTLLVFVNGIIQIYDIDLGRIKPVAWASAPHLQAASDHSYNHTTANRKLQQVCLSLLRSLPKPLFIAAHTADISKIRSWLPSRIDWGQVSNIILPSGINHSKLLPFIQQEIKTLKLNHSQTTATRLLNSLRFHGPAMAGPVSTMDALYHHLANQLVIANNHAFRTDLKCNQCGNIASSFEFGKACSHCGQHKTVLWNPLIEASWLAYDQKIPVLLVDSDVLEYIGGIGCITFQPEQKQRLSSQANDNHPLIDLVA